MRILLSLAILLCSAPAFAAPTGKEIVDKVVNQPAPTSALVEIKMTVSGEGTGDRKLTSYMKKVDGKTNSVVKFQAPADYRGAGILVIEKEDGETDRYIRFQGQRRVRKLPAGSQSGSFLNTDFSYEDMDGQRDPNKAKHTLLGEETLNGQAVYKVESIADKGTGSAYARIIQWVRKDNFVPVQIEFFKEGAEPVKRLVVNEIKKIDGFWISTRSTMSTLDKGTSTELIVESTDFKTPIPDRTFHQNFLTE
jgi:hypothetical protein